MRVHSHESSRNLQGYYLQISTNDIEYIECNKIYGFRMASYFLVFFSVEVNVKIMSVRFENDPIIYVVA